ncbi:hypothetical protein INT45_005465 [Circinella minor]|uniref:Uncharacterized protein n=1 Tax=Circinella minor TaxID=1195481 RepID=A0A8H7RZT6_9FUNG|nr:hypothetical protein INT45_005465 [Circinella minor]
MPFWSHGDIVIASGDGRVQEIFSKMDKENIWVLEATKAAAAGNATGETYHVPSVAEKMLHFALNCNFRQRGVERTLEETGDGVLVPIDITIEEKLNEVDELDTAKEVYSYAPTIQQHDPKKQPLLAVRTLQLKFVTRLQGLPVITIARSIELFFVWDKQKCDKQWQHLTSNNSFHQLYKKLKKKHNRRNDPVSATIEQKRDEEYDRRKSTRQSIR